MSETLTLLGVDAYISALGDVTPSNLRRFERVTWPRETPLQQEWARDPFGFSRQHSQLIKSPTSPESEGPGNAWQTSIRSWMKFDLPKVVAISRTA